MSDWHESLLWFGKLLLAAVLGGAIGFERESHGQAAGLRTNVLVATASCLMMMLSIHMEQLFRGYGANSHLGIDPGRMASYAIAGMGFLGAGAIVKGKGTVKGLTTAAGLWLNCGIGLAIGIGYYFPAICTTLLSLLILYNLRFLKLLFSHDVHSVIGITCFSSEKQLKTIRAIIAEFPHITVGFVDYRHNFAKQTVTYRLQIICKENTPFGIVVGRLQREVPGIKEITWEEGEVP